MRGAPDDPKEQLNAFTQYAAEHSRMGTAPAEGGHTYHSLSLLPTTEKARSFMVAALVNGAKSVLLPGGTDGRAALSKGQNTSRQAGALSS